MVKKQIWDIILKITRKGYEKEYSEFKNLNNGKKLLKFQNNSLRNLLYHAYKNVPYYTKIIDKIGIVKNPDIIDLSKFNEIPILTKNIIRKHTNTLISKDYQKRGWYHYSSGGSTGEPLNFIKDLSYNKRAKATWKYYKHTIGINNDPKNIYLWGSDRDIREGTWDIKEILEKWFTNTKLLNCFKMNEEDMRKYCKFINLFKPKYISGYTGCLYEICQFAEKEEFELFTPKLVISAAETLRKEVRQKIENVFGTKLYDSYGSREAACIAGECKYGLMHTFSFNNYVEILDKNNLPVKEGEEGKVIVTNLHNYSMPLIRYEIGDMAVLGPKNCKCGSPLPPLKKITGRITDHFKLKDGTMVSAEFFIHLIGVVCNKGKIIKFQVIQEDYKKIKILAVLKENISYTERKDIDDKIKIVMGKDCKINWEFVEDIPKTKSGKYIYTKSMV